MSQLFLDLDGVLADFDGAYARRVDPQRKPSDPVDWDRIRALPHFYRDLPPTRDCTTLFHAVYQLKPVILTGVPYSVDGVVEDKIIWVQRYLGQGVKVICTRSAEKCEHGLPGDVLIDDNAKYRPLWENMGGIWIQHEPNRGARASIQALKDLGMLKP